MNHRLRPLHIALVLALSLGVALMGGVLAWRLALGRIAADLDLSLTLTHRAIEAEIDRFRYLPQVAAQDIRIQTALASPADPAAIDAANRYLQTVATQSGATQLYLLDETGLTIASSNWSEPGSFVGSDYSFRPYFLDAMRQGAGSYYAIGVTTGRPGYFISRRLDLPGGLRAVAVVKIELLELQAAWRSAEVMTAIADGDGIVFLSGQPEWLYRPLEDLSPAVLARVATTRRYDGVDLVRQPPLLAGGDDTGLVTLGGRALVLRGLPMRPEGWRVLQAAPPQAALTAALGVAGSLALATLAVLLLGQTLLQRRRLVRLRLQQGRLLEAQVERRTRELAREIETRIAAEADLRAAQEALIHAEKMAALGRMSSAIVHEISQPLAAMEATLAAAALRAGKGDTGTASRIETARGHIRRMLRTITHLKTFGRKESGSRARIALDLPLRNAVDLVRHRADGLGVPITLSLAASAPEVMAGLVRLEQVFVNLLLNALDALVLEGGATRPGAAIDVALRYGDGRAEVDVHDNGAGIAPEALGKIFEPFFSSKTSGDGLGLGLSICQSILGEFNGVMRFDSVPGQGTRVCVSLPLAEAQGEVAA